MGLYAPERGTGAGQPTTQAALHATLALLAYNKLDLYSALTPHRPRFAASTISPLQVVLHVERLVRMDPATVGGLAIGVASLAFDVFDNCIKCRLASLRLPRGFS